MSDEPESDRRAQAFAVLDERQRTGRITSRPLWAALRSVLERHHVGELPKDERCVHCDWRSPCPDEIAIVDALVPDE